MPEQFPNPSGDERLDENLSRLLNRETHLPRLPAEADAQILAALVQSQAELYPQTLSSGKDATVKPAATTDTSRLNRTGYMPPAVACLLLFGAIAGMFFLARPAKRPIAGANPQKVTPVAHDASKVARKQLSDGTILIAQAGAKFVVDEPRCITLQQGDLYLIVAKADEPFVVKTDNGEVIATGTRFVVSADKTTSAAVAQGTVRLTGENGSVELQAGEQGELKQDQPPTRGPAPRLSYLVNWAKEALSQEELLVEKVESENGLIAVDPWGQESRLTLRKYDVDIYIEDGIARTTIDQTFFNHYPWNTEGTFYFPLPRDASVSRLAMYVAGQLNEGGMVERGRGQQIYNDILHQNRDPALLEMMEGNVFKMRIFPLEGRQEKRIFLSYTQKLSELYGRMRYWFPMDHTNSIANELSIRVRVKDGAKQYNPQSSTHQLKTTIDGDDLVLTYDAKKQRPDQDLLLHLVPSTSPAATRVATCKNNGQRFIFARFTPQLPGKVEPQARQWIVVNDISASRSKIDQAAQRYILSRLVEEANDDDSLFLINLNTRPELVSQAFTPIRSKASRDLLDRAVAPRLGATNMVAGMQAVEKVIKEHGVANPHILYLGDGVATDGSKKAFEPVRAVPRNATFVGIGVGKKVDSLFLQEAADRTGGMFTTINPDEDIDWRIFDLVAALNTPRLTKLKVQLQDPTGNPIKAIAYPNSRSLSHGETLTVVARCEDELPATIILSGEAGGKPYRSIAEVTEAQEHAEYIPRLWAKRHIDQLLKSDMEREDEIIALSKQYYVVTPLTSLIVLEDDKMYEEYKVERGRKDHWAIYGAPKKIDVVQEPVDWGKWGWYHTPVGDDEKIEAKAKPKTVREIVDSVQLRIDAPFYYLHPASNSDQAHYAACDLIDNNDQPTHLLTYWFLLAAGDRQLAANLSNDLRHQSASSATTPGGTPSNSSPSEGISRQLLDLPSTRLLEGTHMNIPIEVDRIYLRHGWFRPLSMGPTGDTMEMPLAKPLPIGNRRSISFRYRDLMAPIMRQTQLFPRDCQERKRFPRRTLLSDTSSMLHSQGAVSGLSPELSQSLARELQGRWARINRDIRQANGQQGYRSTWGPWHQENGIDLRNSGNNWYSGLNTSLKSEESELEERMNQSFLTPFPEPPSLQGQTDGEQGRQVVFGRRGGESLPVPMFSMNTLGQALHTQPGACVILAADYLSPRHDELATKQLSDEDKVELQAIDKALGSIDVAAERLEDTSPFWGWEGWTYRPQSWTFCLPTMQVYHGYNWSYDLTRYTPALKSDSQDIADEVVSQFGVQPEGKVGAAAAKAIRDARAAIRPVSIRYEEDGQPVLVASGDRFAMSRRSDMYLQERMVCDGQQVVHTYNEIGLAARRTASPLRLASLRQVAPHLIEPPEALAERFDVRLTESADDSFTLLLSPLGQADDAAQTVSLTVRVDKQGRIQEQTLQVDDQPQLTLVFGYDTGKISAAWRNADGKDLATFSYAATPLDDLSAFELDLAEHVVIDMPLRKPSFYQQQREALVKTETESEITDEDTLNELVRLKRHQALAHIQQLQGRHWGGISQEATSLLLESFTHLKTLGKTLQVGDIALIGSTGANTSQFDKTQIGKAAKSHPIVSFYNLRHSNWGNAQEVLKDHMDGLLGHLAAFQACSYYGEEKYQERFEFFTKTFPDSPLLLSATHTAANQANNVDAWMKLYDHPRWRALAMLFSTCRELTARHRAALATSFEKLYDDLAAEGLDMPVTGALASAIKQHVEGKIWKRIAQDKLARAKKADSTAALLAFAEQAMSWGETPLADEAFALARERLAETDTLSGRFALAQTYWAGGRPKEAWKLYLELFEQLDKLDIRPSSSLLAAAARLAQQADDLEQAIELEEQALATEHPYLPDLINLQAYRQRYNWLWKRYQEKISEAVYLKDQAAIDAWFARAEATWQQWYEVDSGNHGMITQMATLQMSAARQAKAWLYLSSIIDARPRDANSHYALSQWYQERNDLDKAQKRLAQAYQWDTANPRWLWERGQLLQRMERPDEARKLYQQVVDGEWANALQGYAEQAKEALRN